MTENVAPPTCYRHPGRETYVRCTRCDRPICPDCMVSASVGHQCPECVAEGNAGVRTARTRYGGALTTSAPGLVTRVLIGINVAVFLLELIVGIDVATRRFGMSPVLVADGEVYRLVTAGFLHYSLWHIGFNMFALYFFGTHLETEFGRWRYLLVYGLSLVGGSVASYTFSDVSVISAGASGAVFGLFGAYGVLAVKQRLDLRPFLVLLAINFAFVFLPGSTIDWRAHLGGLVVGGLVAAAIVFAPREQRTLALVAAVLVVVAVLAAMSAWRTADLWPYVELYRLRRGGR